MTKNIKETKPTDWELTECSHMIDWELMECSSMVYEIKELRDHLKQFGLWEKYKK